MRFDAVLAQLCGGEARYPDPATGRYPAINGSGFVQNYWDRRAPDPTLVMKCFDPTQVPVLTTLAREFAVCDCWFSSLPGPTWPNRFFAHAATSGGLDDSPSALDVLVHEVGAGFEFENSTIYDRLGDDWLVFHGDPFPHVFSIKGMLPERLAGRFQPQSRFEAIVSDPMFSAKYVFIEPNYGRVYGDYAFGNSQHPLDDMTQGEWLIKRVYEAIRQSPHWNESALLITYDEHGGFYDHVVPPPATPPGDAAFSRLNIHGFDFAQLGVRVPAVIVSPLIEKGTIDHRVYDHSSVPATLIKLFDLPAVDGKRNLTARDAAANTFESVFSRDEPRLENETPRALPDPPDSGFRADADDDSIPDFQIDPAVGGFLYVAFLRQYGVTPEIAARSPIAARFLRISTRVQAMNFFEEVRGQVQGA
jgi:phospholipase C